MVCKSGFDGGVWSAVSTLLRPAHLGTITIQAGDIAGLYGGHCSSGQTGTLTVTINGNATYIGPVSGSLIPSNVSGNTITYTIFNFDSIASGFAFELLIDTFATINSQICVDISITPTNDNDSTNNTLTQCFTVRAS